LMADNEKLPSLLITNDTMTGHEAVQR
jgi:hypothetical protein